MALHELGFSGRRVPIQTVLLGNFLQNLEPCLSGRTCRRKLFNDLLIKSKTIQLVKNHFIQERNSNMNKKEASIINCTIDTRIRTELRRNHDKLFPIFGTEKILKLKKIRHFRAPRSSKDNASNSFSQLSRAFPNSITIPNTHIRITL